MAENTTEESTTKSMENKMSSALEISSADDRAVSFDKKENHEQTDSDKLSTSKEASEVTAEKEKIESTDLLSSEKQQDPSKTDCNGDLKDDTNLDKTGTSETDRSETKESSSDELRPSEARSGDENYIYTTAMQSNLDILTIVPRDLAMEMLQDADESTIMKDGDRENNDEQQTVKKKDDVSADNTADSTKKGTASPKDKRDSRGSLEKTEEKSNFGIVCSPTAIGELIEEQLANDSALSTDRTDHIVEWVKNSVKIKANEEINIIEECKSENMTNEAEKRKRLSITPPFISLRKSQKLVSNIIKKSIKW